MIYILYIIERKTYDDFFSSLIDGRYETQKIILYHHSKLLNLPSYNIIYLFEENSNYLSEDNNRIIEGAKLNLVQRDKMTIYETKSMIHTLYRLALKLKTTQDHQEWTTLNLIDHIKSLNALKLYDENTEQLIHIDINNFNFIQKESKIIATPKEEEEEEKQKKQQQLETFHQENKRNHFLETKDIAFTFCTGKKQNLTPEQQFIIDVRNRKKCGPKMAKALSRHFTTIFDLQSFITNDEIQAKNFIAQIQLEEGKNRSIGKKTAKTFCETFLNLKTEVKKEKKNINHHTKKKKNFFQEEEEKEEEEEEENQKKKNKKLQKKPVKKKKS